MADEKKPFTVSSKKREGDVLVHKGPVAVYGDKRIESMRKRNPLMLPTRSPRGGKR